MLFIILFAALGAGLPLQNNNNTATEKVGWTEAPQARGTFDLLLSCLTTLSLCAWTAYHPNVHFARSGWSRWSHRLLWMFIAVFVPEIVLWCACDQWWVARQLKKTVNEMIEKKTKEKRPHRTASLTSSSSSSSSAQSSLKPWTLEQAFFALSGGFALPSSIPSHPPRTLTPLGIILLLKLDILPNVDPNTIADKSKADGIAKALVCIQAAWFFVQCIARAAKKLPVTVLEIHVLAHVLCAFAIYAVWFRKGYDICAPIVIDGEEAESLGALFVLDAGPVRNNFQCCNLPLS
ncbi:hypothetical protein DM02DRAFT_604135 [Periconia macrospinosa]|uniref:Uncharacterized protein n=1 Tax=Periconia macrospinosa TaxID=97972 RepID=A0A2V1D5L4_9PLEO|nr:hypothetical protein DM02DRAFT_604135 [Periconia macrospinosa]